MRVYRLVDEAFLDQAWTGEGARLHGGRWNRPGVAVVYCSDHAALAVLEVIAGGLKPEDLAFWRLLTAEVPEKEIVDLPAGQSDRDRGEAWLATGRLACRVPSRVVEGTNVLFNPSSASWQKVRFLGESRIDPRLWADDVS